jgi:hypothetical protein
MMLERIFFQIIKIFWILWKTLHTIYLINHYFCIELTKFSLVYPLKLKHYGKENFTKSWNPLILF